MSDKEYTRIATYSEVCQELQELEKNLAEAIAEMKEYARTYQVKRTPEWQGVMDCLGVLRKRKLINEE